MLPLTNPDPKALFVARIWRPGIGPALAALRGEVLHDITSREAPTMRDLLELDDPAGFVGAARGEAIGDLADLIAGSGEGAVRPATRARVTLTTTHDWVDVRPLGFLEAPARPVTEKRRRREAKDQGDLFTPGTPKPSDIALAGFRNPDGSRQAPPPNPPPVPANEGAARKPRWTGV